MAYLYSDESSYSNVCLKAYNEDECFNKFKQDDTYQIVLEHTSISLGKEYFKRINNLDKTFFDENYNKLRINDTLGTPTKYNFGNYDISPSTLRYIYDLFEIRKYIGSLDNYKIVEIGGGYGGLCTTISSVNKFKEYVIYDIKYPAMLTKKYLDRMNISNIRVEFNQILKEKDVDLVISNYAFAELHKDLQDKYMENIIINAKHGFIIFNNISKTDARYSYDEFESAIKSKHNILTSFHEDCTPSIILIW
jgi:putative sugar O-methyltransferase